MEETKLIIEAINNLADTISIGFDLIWFIIVLRIAINK